jgi:hypothetical protein
MGSRHESGPQDQQVCPGVFCLYSTEAGGGGGEGAKVVGRKIGGQRSGTLFNTENAMRKERDALQDTLTSFRRTMAATSSLVKKRRGNHEDTLKKKKRRRIVREVN